jgi:hypothetical protein
MSHQAEDPELTALAGALAGLRPAARPPDRDRLLIQLGRAQARPRLWQALTAAFALATVGLGWRLATVEPTVVERVVSVPAPAEPSADPAAGVPLSDEGDSYWRLRQQVTGGQLPPPAAPRPPARTKDLPPELTDGLAAPWIESLRKQRNM